MARWSLLLVLALACTPKPTVPEAAGAQQPAEAAATVRTSPIDSRIYKTFTLDNGMKVLVTSDATVDLAAASLDVHIGQFSDPEDREGLAHFLEHMLFMGTDRYPDVDDYRRYIQDHGGRSNAGTGQEHTSYYFSVAQDHLEPALDRFSRFFVAPRLDPEFVQRERNAVNAEYSLKVKDDLRRIREVKRQTSNPAHPFSKFSVGNLDTLADRGEDLVYDDLKTMYASEYTASRMTLSVIGTQSVDALEAMVRARFAEVPTNGKPAPKATVPLFTPDQLGARVHITPLSDRREVTLQFPVPPELPVHDKHPIGYLTRLLGHEGDGSLFIRLRDLGWAESLSAGTDGTEDTTLINISIRLTEDGFTHRDDAVETVFEYIRLLQGQKLPARYHEEAATLAAQAFAWAEPPSPVNTVRSTVRTLQDYPPEHVLDARYQYGEFDETLVRQWLDKLTPQNLHLLVVGPDLETDQVEVRYDVPYALQPLEPELITRWSSSEIDAKLTLPAPNPYVAESLAVRAAAPGAARPVQIGDDPILQLWHHQDAEFGVPKATIEVFAFSPLASKNAKARLMNRLLTTLLDDSLQTVRYPASQAGLRMDVASHALGLRWSASGYDPKLADLIDVMTERIADFQVPKDRFEIQRARMVRSLKNVSKDRPISQGQRAMNTLFDTRATPAATQATMAEALTHEELQAYADAVLNGATGRVLVHGNLTAAQAEQVRTATRKAFTRGSPASRPAVQTRKIPAGAELVQDVEIDHNDSILLVQYRGQGATIEEQARYRLLGSMLRTPFFTEIRTRQQLGYLTYAAYTSTDVLPGLTMGIQSSTAGPTTLLERVDAFLVEQRALLTDMPESEVETIKQGLITKLTEKETRLSARSSRYRSELWLGFTAFDRREQIVAALQTLDKAALLQTFDQVLLEDTRGRVIVRSTGAAHRKDDTTKVPCKDAECIIKKMPEMLERTP
ncbi:MAG: insulinase family protein [Myxococcota bacterium]